MFLYMEGLQHHQLYGGVMNIDTVGGGGDSRFPQWSVQETRDFLVIRAEFDPSFMETKRNKLLWEAIATKMREKGYNRSSEQCKCKWKNLVTRYKGCETMEGEAMRQQFPFYNELHAIFTVRMERMLWMEAEGNVGKKKVVHLSSEEEDDNEDNSEGEKGGGSSKKKRKIMKNNPSIGNSSSAEIVNGMKEMLDDFMKQQMEMEMQWLRSYEAREEERRTKEMEFRQTMERLENERLMMEIRWREREEQRKMREEARAEKRDALITALLDKLRRDEVQPNYS